MRGIALQFSSTFLKKKYGRGVTFLAGNVTYKCEHQMETSSRADLRQDEPHQRAHSVVAHRAAHPRFP